jgi:hypothetical protein
LIIADLPFSATSIGPISTEPPFSAVAVAARSTSSVIRWMPHASGYPIDPSLCMQPATALPSFVKTKYPPNPSCGGWAVQPRSSP